MYYEEKEENGVWYYKNSPNVKWAKFKARNYSEKIKKLEDRVFILESSTAHALRVLKLQESHL